ncbi:hypothetical protein STRDD11_01531 [Streptococcus sp. DD11]|uniref:DUF3114 domain-containing protein n=1 Tax=Streptococcus sp. DD11 TaxID=1777879 RepID=UPI00079A7D36|nr:DUF3114 domain-containing protein [Streptococcus sp. DD11]KXT83365.1 hypothetical protein STRDD11_01531 [Streptococcus sp. DD11]
MSESAVSLAERSRQLREAGWSGQAVRAVFEAAAKESSHQERPAAFEAAQLFGSPLFKSMWQLDSKRISPQRAQQLLELAMACVNMPKELTGTKSEAQNLLSRIDSDLAPHDPFWRLFARTLQQAFPYDDFRQQDGNQRLKRQLHQFRYVISCQQAQWVRQHFRQPGMTDAEALAAYLQALPKRIYSFRESSRLHNKAYIDQSGLQPQVVYPDGQSRQANFKILINFHTEFILDREGAFLNILDPERTSQNGLVNGASFNYGNRNRPGNRASHSRCDVKPPAVWDPAFRREAIRNGGRPFKSPQNNRGPLGYRSAKSAHAQDGRSAKQTVDQEIRRFKRLLGRPLVLLRIWGRVRRLGQKLAHVFK